MDAVQVLLVGLHRVQHHQQTEMRLSENMQVARYAPLEAILVDIRDHDSDYGNDVLIILTLIFSNHQPLKLPVSVAPRTRNIAKYKIRGHCTSTCATGNKGQRKVGGLLKAQNYNRFSFDKYS